MIDAVNDECLDGTGTPKTFDPSGLTCDSNDLSGLLYTVSNWDKATKPWLVDGNNFICRSPYHCYDLKLHVESGTPDVYTCIDEWSGDKLVLDSDQTLLLTTPVVAAASVDASSAYACDVGGTFDPVTGNCDNAGTITAQLNAG